MKQMLTVVSSLVVALFLVACGGDSSSGPDELGSSSSEFLSSDSQDTPPVSSSLDFSSDSNESAEGEASCSSSKSEENSSESTEHSEGSSDSNESSSGVECSSSVESVSSSSSEQKNKCDAVAFDSKSHFCDRRAGGTIYKKVTIGDHTWMAENLNYATDEGSFCNPKIEGFCDTYGRFYLWAAAVGKTKEECGYGHKCNLDADETVNIRGVCPEGWHLPRYSEWVSLINAVGGVDIAGSKLKSQTGWKWDKYGDVSGNGTDEFEFSALPANYRDDEEEGNGDLFFDYDESGWYDAFFWSATESDEESAYSMQLHYSDKDVYLSDDFGKGFAFSVRCVQD